MFTNPTDLSDETSALITSNVRGGAIVPGGSTVRSDSMNDAADGLQQPASVCTDT